VQKIVAADAVGRLAEYLTRDTHHTPVGVHEIPVQCRDSLWMTVATHLLGVVELSRKRDQSAVRGRLIRGLSIALVAGGALMRRKCVARRESAAARGVTSDAPVGRGHLHRYPERREE
jgi:hypothetical protein